jgi:hypothetical protein
LKRDTVSGDPREQKRKREGQKKKEKRTSRLYKNVKKRSCIEVKDSIVLKG